MAEIRSTWPGFTQRELKLTTTTADELEALEVAEIFLPLPIYPQCAEWDSGDPMQLISADGSVFIAHVEDVMAWDQPEPEIWLVLD
jgi:hypothetical protein